MDTLVSMLYVVAKYFLLAVLGLVIYLSYIILMKPYLFRQKYKKFANVYVSERFVPLIGDLQVVIDAVKQGKVFYNYYRENSGRMKGFDLEAKLEGIN